MRTIKGEYADHRVRPSVRFPAGRVCAADECDTRLSIYNRRPYCWQHDEPKLRAIPARISLRI